MAVVYRFQQLISEQGSWDMMVVGVDGCKFGWVAARVDLGSVQPSEKLKLKSFLTFEEIVDAYYAEADAIAVDIPIGLIECQRRADIEARAILGKRKSSVFPAPDPRVVHMDDYWEANARMQELCGKGVSRQAFAIFRKVAEVNDVVLRRDSQQSKIIEIHPEVCFWAMNGEQAMSHPKRTDDGFRERLELLRDWLHLPLWNNPAIARKLTPGAEADDVLDAIVAGWTARRLAITPGGAGRFPVSEERDGKKLRAEIVY
jgi:predicted RNase H-like nuclease